MICWCRLIMMHRFLGILLATMLSLLALPVGSQAADPENDEARAQLKAAYIAMVREELETALELLEPLVQDNNAEALFLKSEIHGSNPGFDKRDTLIWYEEAADGGFVPAMMASARTAMMVGLTEHAFARSLRAAKKGDALAYMFLSQFYCKILGVVLRDPLTADAWLIIGLGGELDVDRAEWDLHACGPKNPDEFRRGQLEAQVKIIKQQFHLPTLKDHTAHWKRWKAEALADNSVQEPE